MSNVNLLQCSFDNAAFHLDVLLMKEIICFHRYAIFDHGGSNIKMS